MTGVGDEAREVSGGHAGGGGGARVGGQILLVIIGSWAFTFSKMKSH